MSLKNLPLIVQKVPHEIIVGTNAFTIDVCDPYSLVPLILTDQ